MGSRKKTRSTINTGAPATGAAAGMGDGMKTTTNQFFLQASQDFLKEFYGKIEEAVERLDDRQVWARPNPASNSIGNLLLHLAGNLRQHIISGCGGVPDVRKRTQEFHVNFDEMLTPTKGVLLSDLEQTVKEACDVLAKLDPSVLMETRVIQNKEVVLLQDIYHAVEHFSYHTGQIVMRVKELSAKGFSWYDYLEGT